MTDEQSWLTCHEDDAWIFDKLLLSRRLGYDCGPKGVDVSIPGDYIIRPCVNINGLGAGAKVQYLQKNTDRLPNGSFWCQVFKGRHLSVDYYQGRQMICVEGVLEDDDCLQLWKYWIKTDDVIPFPNFLKNLKGSYDWINVEYIDGKVIEVHLRRNPDFATHDSSYVVPVWVWQKVSPSSSQRFIVDKDGYRLGFYIEA